MEPPNELTMLPKTDVGGTTLFLLLVLRLGELEPAPTKKVSPSEFFVAGSIQPCVES